MKYSQMAERTTGDQNNLSRKIWDVFVAIKSCSANIVARVQIGPDEGRHVHIKTRESYARESLDFADELWKLEG